MKKLMLAVESLEVESFATTTPGAERGTVFGEHCTCYTHCTCPGCPSCGDTCNATCNATCPNTCWESCYGDCSWHSCIETCDWIRCGPDVQQP